MAFQLDSNSASSAIFKWDMTASDANNRRFHVLNIYFPEQKLTSGSNALSAITCAFSSKPSEAGMKKVLKDNLGLQIEELIISPKSDSGASSIHSQ